MSLAIRIIPRLDIEGHNLVKGMHLKGLRVLNDLKKYVFVSTWISKKSTFWKDISSCFPIKNKNIPFIIHKKLSDDIFLNKNNKTIHYVLGDGDNI